MIKEKKLKLQKFLLIGLIKKPGKHVSLESSNIRCISGLLSSKYNGAQLLKARLRVIHCSELSFQFNC